MKASFKKLPDKRKNAKYQVILRPILSVGKLCCQAEYTYPKKVTHRNLPLTEAAALCLALCEQDFKQINIFTPTEQIQVLAARPERPAIRRTPQAEQAERGKKLRREGSGSSNDLGCEQTKCSSGSDFNCEGADRGSRSLIPNSQTASRPGLHCQSHRAFLPFCRRVRGVRALAQPPKALSDSDSRRALRLSDSPRRDGVRMERFFRSPTRNSARSTAILKSSKMFFRLCRRTAPCASSTSAAARRI